MRSLPADPREALARVLDALGRGSGPARAVELVLFALAAPLLGRVLFPHDPLGLDGGFPWAALGPAVFAARYGVGAGIGCALLAALAVALPQPLYAGRGEALVALAVGTLLLATFVGEAAGAWRRRGLAAEAENAYLRHRLEEFSNDYHVLKVSHGQLEEFLAGQRLSLREALRRVAASLSDDGGLGTGEELMAVFAQFCSVQVAGLYAMRTPELVDPEPRATHGAMGELPRFDPLLRLAIAERRLASVTAESAASGVHPSTLLAVAPIVDSRGELHGVLAIRDMHFMAFQQRNLDLLALLVGYVGDLVARAGGLDDAPGERFVAELDTALRFARGGATSSMLIRLRFAERVDAAALIEEVAGSVRSLDSVWRLPSGNEPGGATLAVLLPLAGERGAAAWLRRVDEALVERAGVTLRETLLSAETRAIAPGHTRRDCLEFVLPASSADAHGAERSSGPETGDDRAA